jgi:uncharacterized membrane protein
MVSYNVADIRNVACRFKLHGKYCAHVCLNSEHRQRIQRSFRTHFQTAQGQVPCALALRDSTYVGLARTMYV